MAQTIFKAGTLVLVAFFVASCGNRKSAADQQSMYWPPLEGLELEAFTKAVMPDSGMRVAIFAPLDNMAYVQSVSKFPDEITWFSNLCPDSSFYKGECRTVSWDKPEMKRLEFDRIILINSIGMPEKLAKFLAHIKSRMRLGAEVLLLEPQGFNGKFRNPAQIQPELGLSGFLRVEIDSSSLNGHYLIRAR